MRWLHIAVVVIFVAVVLIFSFQNLTPVTMTFLGIAVRLPLAVLAVGIYLLGMLTGGSVWSLVRRSIAASRQA